MRPRDIWSKVAATILLAVGWLHELLKPVGEWLSVSMLSFWEETARSFVRAWFISAGRYINATSAALLSLLSFRSYSRTQRRQAAQRSKAWESWWRDTRGTFNALLEREGFSPPEVTAKEVPGSQQNGVGPRLPPPPTAPPRRRWGIWRRASSGSDVLVPQGTNLFSSTAQSLTDATARRGLLEDVRLSIEIGLTKTFAALRRVIRAAFFLEKVPESPNVRGSLKRKRFGPGTARMREEQAAFTASDAILRAGYPLEEHSVTTADGYVLQMHRIPRRGARDVVLFQHGVLDTSLGWVALGPGGSAAFAAHDAGFDVWLANTRANPPRLNVNPERKGAKYWRYSANDLALDDLPAQINHIHRIKIGELTGAPSGAGGGQGTRAGGLARSATEACLPKDVKPTADDEGHGGTAGRGLAAVHIDESLPLRRSQSALAPMDPPTTAPPAPSALEHSFLEGAESNEDLSFEADPEALPYRLQAVGHSLGAACLLMYAVACRRQGLPHRLSRLVLLSPAGFHPRIPLALRLFKWMFPVVCWVLRKVRPSMGVGLRLPSPALRWVTFKLMADLQRSPALMDLFKAGISVATSGDTSHWHAAMALPHYSPQAMPAISLHTTNHFAQWARHPEFRMYDYGTAAANMEHYGSTVPPSIAQNYSLLSDLPVDLAAGTSDGLIAPENVEQHARWLTKAGVRCTLRYFSYGHLQFTFGVKEEVVSYVLSRLRQSTCGALAVNGSSLGKA